MIKLFLSIQASTVYFFSRMVRLIFKISGMRFYFGKCPQGLAGPCIVFFPVYQNRLFCGLSGIVAFKASRKPPVRADFERLKQMLGDLEQKGLQTCLTSGLDIASEYLSGGCVKDFFRTTARFKCREAFYEIFTDSRLMAELKQIHDRLNEILAHETRSFSEHMGRLESSAVNVISKRIDTLKDISWQMASEIEANIEKVRLLMGDYPGTLSSAAVGLFKNINAVLNSIDRLEVRGRDSAGISLMFVLDKVQYESFEAVLRQGRLIDEFKARLEWKVLGNRCINVHEHGTENRSGSMVGLSLTYKIAAEIGSLGDNVRFLRKQISEDVILKHLSQIAWRHYTLSSHTRWASVGVIAEANCHPLDSRVAGRGAEGIIHVCLNGDIDNYLELKAEHEREGNRIAQEITTDTKIIPLQIEAYLRKGYDIVESFRMAVNDFKGSHAISMHTDLAPGKFFLAQKGSGQAVFIGIAEEHYMPTSEVYGFVEETSSYIKMNGETAVNEKTGEAGGQIVILNQQSAGGLSGIEAMHYDGTPISLAPEDIQQTRITSRDIDRQGHPHYFFKEIMESPASVEKTIQNRWKHIPGSETSCAVFLDEAEFPAALRQAFAGNRIRRIFFVGQGTAGVAAQVCADILHYYLNDPELPVCALKSSELSGFRLVDGNNGTAMSDTLVVAVTQSGTTTDTNRAVDMVRARGAHTLAIVNRRESDVTFKVNGVVYTSSGRDIEMSVASTKAFYSQIVAGALVALFIAQLKGARDVRFVTEAVRELRELPGHMRTILAGHENIAASARRTAVTKTYWATVGSGPNKASADEIRIKLSELCYKTISSDFIEDKKHIDLSSEPLIIVCAAGVREAVIGDIIKDAAIFRAHKATPVVIADEGDHRFDSYAVDVFHVPRVSEQLAPVVNTLVGHIWGYYAALAINEGSRFLFDFRQDIEKIIGDYLSRGLDIFEIILEKRFREKIARFDHEFRRRKAEKRFPTAIGFEKVVDLTLLLKYLAGKLPVSEFEMDFGAKGRALNIVNTLMECMAEFINATARPVDAIKHQAKTVTVGTSRLSEKIGGILFDKLAEYNLGISRLTPRNVLVLRNLQEIVLRIEGEILYRIGGLNLLGEPTEETTIQIVKKSGSLALIPSRVDADTRLKGTKRIIVRQGNVYIGRGRKDDRKIIVIPLLSEFPAPPVIECLLLLNFDFKENVSLDARIKALGGKYEHIKNIVQENSIQWDKAMIDRVKIEDLFGISAEKIAEQIIVSLR